MGERGQSERGGESVPECAAPDGAGCAEVSVRCGGGCCRKFYLPFGHAELEALRADPAAASHWKDGVQVIAMAVPLLGVTRGMGGEELADAGRADHYYTCSNLDVGSGLCLAYESRPAMCRGYPYGAQCVVPGCAGQGSDSSTRVEEPRLRGISPPS